VHPDAHTAAAMDALLDQLGCSSRMAVPGEARALPGGSLDLTGAAAAPPPGALRLLRAHAPDAHPVFPDTKLVDIDVWRPLQAKRVRYFYKPPPAASSGAATTPAPPASTGIRVQSPR
jgi:hypothetical protein